MKQNTFRLVKQFSLQISLITLILPAVAQPQPIPESKVEVAKGIDLVKEKSKPATTLPSENQPPKQRSVDESIDYLKKNPKEMESLLSELIRLEDSERLALLLPAYQEVANYDASVVDWGNAIIAEQKGDSDTAIKLYRKINAALPNIKLLRFHLSRALYRDKQYEAAKSEFEKLRTESISDADVKIVEEYITEINKKDNWTFNGSISYLNDPNINNSPEKGTKIEIGNGSITAAGPESGRGFSYSFSADKRWSHKNNLFTALHLGTNGLYYWNNKSYNELSTNIGIGAGVSTSRFEIEVGPYLQNRLYTNDAKELSQYSKNFGLRADISYWLSPKWKYQTVAKLGYDKYINKYNRLDGGNHQWSNTLLYLTSPTQYWYGGLDLGVKKAKNKIDTYQRVGFRLGWGQVWGSGLSTSVNVGYAQKYYQGNDFLFQNSKRNDKELDMGVSVWHRNFHFKGITPRLSWQYHRTNSNQALFNYDKNNVFVEFNKQF